MADNEKDLLNQPAGNNGYGEDIELDYEEEKRLAELRSKAKVLQQQIELEDLQRMAQAQAFQPYLPAVSGRPMTTALALYQQPEALRSRKWITWNTISVGILLIIFLLEAIIMKGANYSSNSADMPKNMMYGFQGVNLNTDLLGQSVLAYNVDFVANLILLVFVPLCAVLFVVMWLFDVVAYNNYKSRMREQAEYGQASVDYDDEDGEVPYSYGVDDDYVAGNVVD